MKSQRFLSALAVVFSVLFATPAFADVILDPHSDRRYKASGGGGTLEDFEIGAFMGSIGQIDREFAFGSLEQPEQFLLEQHTMLSTTTIGGYLSVSADLESPDAWAGGQTGQTAIFTLNESYYFGLAGTRTIANGGTALVSLQRLGIAGSLIGPIGNAFAFTGILDPGQYILSLSAGAFAASGAPHVEGTLDATMRLLRVPEGSTLELMIAGILMSIAISTRWRLSYRRSRI